MLTRKWGQGINRHLETHSSLYVFIIVLFVMGIIFGTLTVQSLGHSQQADLIHYFQQFLHEVNSEHFIDPGYALWQNFIHYLKYIFIIWLLGLSIIGLPLILVLLFLKGVFLGFSVGFLVHQLGWEGFLFSFMSIAPQNMIVVPLIIMMSVISISFSIKLIAHIIGNRQSNPPLQFNRYIGAITLSTMTIFVVALYETYISPLLMRIMAS